MRPAQRLAPIDAIAIVFLLGVVGLYTVRYFAFGMHADEDAAILLRYAKHLAEGHGIVWNVGEPPVEGATDFLFMALVAALGRLGLSIEAAARTIGLVSHVATVVLVYVAAVRWIGAARWMALVSAVFIAVGPGLAYVEAYFGTPFFALLCALTFCFALRMVDLGAPRWSVAGFLTCALLMGLTRPEGVILSAMMLLGVLCSTGLGPLRRILLIALPFVVVGAAYFVWRYRYFGYLLPNPFYVKSDGGLHLSMAISTLERILSMTLAFPLTLLLAFRSRDLTRQAAVFVVPVLGFVAMWAMFTSSMQNYIMRYEYPIVPLVMIWWPWPLRNLGHDWKLPEWRGLGFRNQVVAASTVAMVCAGALYHQFATYRYEEKLFADGLYEIGSLLHDYRDRGYTVAVTEAGLLPLYSEWRTIDAWGLNDPWIAHNDGLTMEYLAQQDPAVIMFHGFFSPLVGPRRKGPWHDMTRTMREFAEQNDYRLAASFGYKPDDTHYYYVKPDLPETDELVQRIRAASYRWSSGARTLNYATIVPSQQAAAGDR